jgi:multiple sugar transport system permease protein
MLVRLRERWQDGQTVFTLGTYSLATFYALVILLPMYYLAVCAFKDNAAIFNSPLALPTSLGLKNFREAEAGAHLIRAMAISLGVAVSAETITLLLAFTAAYAIARIRTPLAAAAEGFFSLGFLIPALAMLVPVVMLMSQLHLLYSPLTLILFYPAGRLPMAIVVLASYLRTVPVELEESAEIDGANRLHVLQHILFPLAVPGIITVVIVNFIGIWNEFLFSLVLVSQKDRTIQVALSVLKGDRLVDYGVLAAGVLISVLPVLVVYVLFLEKVVAGLYVGAVKG